VSTDEIEKLVTQAVSDAMIKIRNGDAKFGTPKTLYEFMWQAAQTFGVPIAAFLVILFIAYQTIPNWVNANIETQKSLTKNLDSQTDKLGTVGTQLKNVGDQLEDVAKYSRETEAFRVVVSTEHKAMIADVAEIKQCTVKASEDRKQQMTEHKAMIQTLETLCEEIKKPDK